MMNVLGEWKTEMIQFGWLTVSVNFDFYRTTKMKMNESERKRKQEQKKML